MRFHSGAASLVLVLLTVCGAEAAVVAPELMSNARRSGSVRVVVALADGASSGTGRSPAARRHGFQRSLARVRGAVTPAAMYVHHQYELAGGFAATISDAGLAQLSTHPDVLRIDPDREGSGGLDQSVPQIRADRVQRRGIQGAGVTIAVLDTGVDGDHPDLSTAIEQEECFCGGNCCPNGKSRQSGRGSSQTTHPHGVHVTGIALSRGVISSVGVAPQASLVAVKVLDDQNRGFLTDWVAGLEWVAVNRPDIRVINMSLVSDALFPPGCGELDALNMMFARLIDSLRLNGTLVFIAAGNNGSAEMVTSPACVTSAVSVGAVDRTDSLAFFSNGPAGVDLLAPGESIVSDAPGGTLTTLSGTSMASPHAAGVAALLFSAVPGASAEQVETAMLANAVFLLEPRRGQTLPRVSALPALSALSDHAELLRGGGSARSDCILEWNFVPPSIAHDGPRPYARCTDGDPLCDIDSVPDQCTFLLSLCFSIEEPLLPQCGTAEPVLFYRGVWPESETCIGDCNTDGVVTVGELVRGVQVAQEEITPRACLAADGDGDGAVTTDELVTATLNAQEGCRAFTDINTRIFVDALPRFPVSSPNTCTAAFPVIVQRDQAQTAAARLLVQTFTRNDYDRVAFICDGRE